MCVHFHHLEDAFKGADGLGRNWSWSRQATARVVCVPLSHLKHASQSNSVFNQFSHKNVCVYPKAWNYWFSSLNLIWNKLATADALRRHHIYGRRVKILTQDDNKKTKQQQKKQVLESKNNIKMRAVKVVKQRKAAHAHTHTHKLTHITYTRTNIYTKIVEGMKEISVWERQQAHRQRWASKNLKDFGFPFDLLSYWKSRSRHEYIDFLYPTLVTFLSNLIYRTMFFSRRVANDLRNLY